MAGTIDGRRYALGTAAFLRDTANIRIDDDLLTQLQTAGNTVVWLADETRLLAACVIGDEVRAGARELVAELEHQGKRVLLLTGDHPAAARRIAAAVGIHRHA